jgi:hypothetical protein
MNQDARRAVGEGLCRSEGCLDGADPTAELADSFYQGELSLGGRNNEDHDGNVISWTAMAEIANGIKCH